jgi:hypothetical protein
MTRRTDAPTLADIAAMFRQIAEELSAFRDENKAERRAMEGRIAGRLDDVLGRLSEYQRSTDARLDAFWTQFDALRTEALMRLQGVEERLTALEGQGRERDGD